MKILLISQVLPYPLDSGPKIKTYHVLRYLAERHHVTLVAFSRSEDPASLEHLNSICADVYTVKMERGWVRDFMFMALSLVRCKPFIMLRDHRREMVQLVTSLSAATKFDIVHADQLNMAQYALTAESGAKVLDAHNALWLLYRRLADTSPRSVMRIVFGRDWKLLREYERSMAETFDVVLAVSEEDCEALVAIGVPPEKIQVIPIAIDSEGRNPIERDPQARNVVHLGTMFWPPNSDGVEWFLSQIWPRIREKRPNSHFDIIGAKPPQSILQYHGTGQGVNVWGYLDDPLPRLRQAAVMVVPMRVGSGIRVKILNAMADGIPVVSTSIGCEGIQVEHGRHLLIADDPESFARATLSLIEDRALSERLTHNAKLLVKSTYNYRDRLADLEAVYQRIAANGKQHDAR